MCDKYLFSVHGLFYYSLNSIFWWIEFLHFNEGQFIHLFLWLVVFWSRIWEIFTQGSWRYPLIFFLEASLRHIEVYEPCQVNLFVLCKVHLDFWDGTLLCPYPSFLLWISLPFCTVTVIYSKVRTDHLTFLLKPILCFFDGKV